MYLVLLNLIQTIRVQRLPLLKGLRVVRVQITAIL